MSSEAGAAATSPLLRVVRGNPGPEELAALVAVLATRPATGDGDAVPEPLSLWGRPQLRRSVVPGPGAWRASGLPQ